MSDKCTCRNTKLEGSVLQGWALRASQPCSLVYVEGLTRSLAFGHDLNKRVLTQKLVLMLDERDRRWTEASVREPFSAFWGGSNQSLPSSAVGILRQGHSPELR